MTTLKKQKDFDARGFVSIWLGNFPVEVGEGGFDDYFPDGFEQDFGFEVDAPAGPECDVSEDGPKPVRDLLNGFSQSDRYLEDAASLCYRHGWTEATTALVFFHMRYEPEGVSVNPNARATFIGAVAMRAS